MSLSLSGAEEGLAVAGRAEQSRPQIAVSVRPGLVTACDMTEAVLDWANDCAMAAPGRRWARGALSARNAGRARRPG